MATIQKIIQMPELGTNLQHLGKFTRTGFTWKKNFLCYDNQNGWQLIKLGPIQVLKRKIFSDYQNTHLSYITREWNRHQLNESNGFEHPLTKRLTELWVKTYPKKSYPPLVQYFGNSQLKDAQVIGIARLNTDPFDSQICAKILNGYADGDVILIEGVDADLIVDGSNDPQTKCMKRKAPVHGWEPQGYMEAHRKIFGATLTLDADFTKTKNLFARLLGNIKFADTSKIAIYDKAPSNQESPKPLEIDAEKREQLWLSALKAGVKQLGDIISRIEEGQSYQEPSLGSILQDSYSRFSLSLKIPEDFALLISNLKTILFKAGEAFEKRKYTSAWTPEMNAFFRESWGVRQASLVNEIDKHVSQGKRVWVCAGSAHFFPNKGKNDSPVIKELKKYKFTIGMANSNENIAYYSFDALRKKVK